MKNLQSFLRITILGLAFAACSTAAKAGAGQSADGPSSSSSGSTRVNRGDPAVTYPASPGHLILPGQVPYLNNKQRYPVGNGVTLAVGEPTGEWSQLSGPGYTSPDFIDSETPALEIDGAEQPLRVEMKRARETGVYYGSAVYGDLQVRLIDYATRGEPWISRLIAIDNTSKTVSHEIRIRAILQPKEGAGITHCLVKDANNEDCGLVVKADRSVKIPTGGMNLMDKSVVISFTDPAATASFGHGVYTLETKLTKVAPGGSYTGALCHYFRQDDLADKDCGDAIRAIRAIDSVGELKKCVADWQSWFEQVAPGYRLENIKEPRARDLVEGGLAVLKTNQSQDGGMIAQSTLYKEGYIRDAVLGLRGLTATGHFDESKRWLIWVDHKFSLFGHIPDSASCEASLADKGNKGDMGNADVEGTALYLLCARDYYHGTKDIQTLNAVNKSLQYSMDVQLKEAIANGYKLEFSGDETEICGSSVLPAGGQFAINAQKQDWALSSVALCAASLDFYMEYLKARGEDPAAYQNTQTGSKMNLKTELSHLLEAMDADFWRTDVPEIPLGFHDSFRLKSNNGWPLKRIVNFTLMPVYFGTPYAADEKARDVSAIAQYFDEKTGFLQMVPGINNGFDGHDLGYLLWSLIEVGNPKKTEVYKALVNGPTVGCWGSYNERYSGDGTRNTNDLRSLETGCNLSAIAKYWGLRF